VDRDHFREKVKPVYEKNVNRVGGMALIEKVINY